MASGFLAANARINASRVEFVRGEYKDMNLFILDDDIELDPETKSSKLKMIMDVKPLLVHKYYPQAFKVVTYTVGANGEKEIHDTMTHSIQRKNRSKLSFTIEVDDISSKQDFHFDFYDSADRLANTYKQTIDFSNF